MACTVLLELCAVLLICICHGRGGGGAFATQAGTDVDIAAASKLSLKYTPATGLGSFEIQVNGNSWFSSGNVRPLHRPRPAPRPRALFFLNRLAFTIPVYIIMAVT